MTTMLEHGERIMADLRAVDDRRLETAIARLG